MEAQTSLLEVVSLVNQRVKELYDNNVILTHNFNKVNQNLKSLRKEHDKLQQTVDETYIDSKTIFLNSTATGGISYSFHDGNKTITSFLPDANISPDVLQKINLSTEPQNGTVAHVFWNNGVLSVKYVSNGGGYTLTPQEIVNLPQDGHWGLTTDGLNKLMWNNIDNYISRLIFTDDDETLGDKKFISIDRFGKAFVRISGGGSTYILTIAEFLALHHDGHYGKNDDGDLIWINVDNFITSDALENLLSTDNTSPQPEGGVEVLVYENGNKKLAVRESTNGVNFWKGRTNKGSEIESSNLNTNWGANGKTWQAYLTFANSQTIYSSLAACKVNDNTLPNMRNYTELRAAIKNHQFEIGFAISASLVINNAGFLICSTEAWIDSTSDNNAAGQELNGGFFFAAKGMYVYDNDGRSNYIDSRQVGCDFSMYVANNGYNPQLNFTRQGAFGNLDDENIIYQIRMMIKRH